MMATTLNNKSPPGWFHSQLCQGPCLGKFGTDWGTTWVRGNGIRMSIDTEADLH